MGTAPLAAGNLTTYAPFTHYLGADVFRIALLIAAVGSGLCVLFLAGIRWGEDRRSASLFCISLALSSGAHAAASLVGLGYPPVWWLLAVRAFVLALTTVALVLVVKEAQRGVWARR